MKIYDLINPSDRITFEAPSHAVAYYVALLVGGGRLGCDCEDGTSLDTLLWFATKEQVEESIEKNLGTNDLDSFLETNWEVAVAALNSFAYGSVGDRKIYNASLAAITDPEKLAEFKAVHEDWMRSSMSQWVDYAWQLAGNIEQKLGGKNLTIT